MQPWWTQEIKTMFKNILTDPNVLNSSVCIYIYIYTMGKKKLNDSKPGLISLFINSFFRFRDIEVNMSQTGFLRCSSWCTFILLLIICTTCRYGGPSARSPVWPAPHRASEGGGGNQCHFQHVTLANDFLPVCLLKATKVSAGLQQQLTDRIRPQNWCRRF